jgi:hypothetical protein
MVVYQSVFAIIMAKLSEVNMRKCPKCSAIFDAPLNFCQTCGAMLETVVEEPLQAADTEIADTKDKMISSPVIGKNLPNAKRRAPRLKELMSEAVESILDHEVNRVTPGDSELTLLNLHRPSTAPYHPRGQCPACGSTKLIRNVPIRFKSSESLDAVAEALILEVCLPVELLADICGDCGHVEQKVRNPQDLYNHYLQSKMNP